MNLILIIAVSIAFIAAMFTGGYEDKAGEKQKKKRGHQPT